MKVTIEFSTPDDPTSSDYAEAFTYVKTVLGWAAVYVYEDGGMHGPAGEIVDLRGE